jgi:arabinose-5-phosphate isomerase
MIPVESKTPSGSGQGSEFRRTGFDLLVEGRRAMEMEAEAIAIAATRLDGDFLRAVHLIQNHPGKIVVTGVGKSGCVARKIAATLCSTGTPAVFLHPLEATHGDLGIYAAGDPTLLISKSGTTIELLRLVPALRQLNSSLIGILGNRMSPLGKLMDLVLDSSVRAEADPHNLTPTASTAVAAALGDALALAVMQARRLTPADFAERHPSGQLGRNLRVQVHEVMHSGDEIAWAARDSSMKSVIIAMNRRPLGAACVTGPDEQLDGLITDGDLRRALENNEDIRTVLASDVMTSHPVTISPDATLREALQLMEDRPSQISVLPVVDPRNNRCLGLVRLHDLYQTDLP